MSVCQFNEFQNRKGKVGVEKQEIQWHPAESGIYHLPICWKEQPYFKKGKWKFCKMEL